MTQRSESLTLHALVTAGGTREPLDDVRVVTNLSTGRFGVAIARALAAAGVETVLLGSEAALARLGADPRIRAVPFASFDDLAAALRTETERPPDLLFMAAAVSDYRPRARQGKLRSDAPRLVVEFERTPKLLPTLRARCGPRAFLVGFKLLSRASREELVTAARRQVEAGELDLCVANDLARLGGEEHPVLLVLPEGGVVPLEGAREAVARELVAFSLRRARAQAPLVGPPLATATAPAGREEAAALLAFAQDARLFAAGSGGNLSLRAGPGAWSTPHAADKAALDREDLHWVTLEGPAGRVRASDARRPSVDAALHLRLYEALPKLRAVLHVHDALALPDARTDFPYPAGSGEEARACLAALGRAAFAGAWPGGSFAIERVQHGALLGLAEDPSALGDAWARVHDAAVARLRALGEDPTAWRLRPVFEGARPVGAELACTGPEGPATALFLPPAARGAGLGTRLLELLDARGDLVCAWKERDFFLDRGYRQVGERRAGCLLEPPSRRADLVAAVSVCLLAPHAGRVLLGRRARGAYTGAWSFPGGKLEADEDEAAGARRELLEETGLAASDPVRRFSLAVGSEPAYRVACFVMPVPSTPPPRASSEFSELRWVPLEEALRLAVSPGVRRVLRWCAERARQAPGSVKG